MGFLKKIKDLTRELTTVHYTADLYEIVGGVATPAGVAYAWVRVWEQRHKVMVQMRGEIERATEKEGSDVFGKVIEFANVRRM